MGRRFESCRAHHDFNKSSQEKNGGGVQETDATVTVLGPDPLFDRHLSTISSKERGNIGLELLNVRRVGRAPAHSPGIEANKRKNVEEWAENEIQDGHKKHGSVHQIDVQHVLLGHKEH
jgi:hypothetical protein